MILKIKEKRHPTFRGRFGKRKIRRKKKKKWNKWRKPRGMDIKRKREDGKQPKPGFRTSKAVRGLHPIGLKEKLIYSSRDLENIQEGIIAFRVAAKIGKRKRKKLLEEAKKKNLIILNP